MHRVAICDDDAADLDHLTSLVRQNRQLELVGAFASGRGLLEAVAESLPDVILLDLEMPEMDGFEAVKGLADLDWTAVAEPPLIVFVTSDPVFAIDLLQWGIVGILNKPSAAVRLESCVPQIHRARTQHEARQRLRHLRYHLEDVRTLYGHAIVAGDVELSHAGRRIRVPLSVIQWIEAQGRYVRLH